MDTESFTALALRVIAREATDDERRALDAELAAHPERRDEFAGLQVTHDVLRTAAPMAEAVRATEPELPAYRLNELRTAVRRHFGPAASRAPKQGLPSAFLRWLMAGGAVTVLGVVVVLVCFSNSAIEIGLYRTSQLRGGGAGLAPENVPAAQVVMFDADGSFDQWQNRPLAWYEHAKIWIDDEHDQLHIVRRDQQGQVVREVLPLAATDEAQREQIRQAVLDLQK